MSIFNLKDWNKRQITVTNNTATEVYSIPLAAEQTVNVVVMATARNSDGSKNGTFFISGSFYRNTGGNVTQVGSTLSINTEVTAGSTIDLTLVADTTNQRISVRVTGETSQTFKFEIQTKYIKSCL